ncbi:MAG: TraR/DksA family transcriptional regulator [Kiritimatiellia bacterium]|jgi:RNA polymerase-binding transcription factor DksA|nr:TraR/DksA family transcriptional regulator [Kiritimatiellia bacterium]
MPAKKSSAKRTTTKKKVATKAKKKVSKPAPRKPAKKSAKKSAPKKPSSAKATAGKKAASKKATPKKATPKKAVKKAVKKAPAKKAAAKKPAAKKPAAKKAPAKKSAAKKPSSAKATEGKKAAPEKDAAVKGPAPRKRARRKKKTLENDPLAPRPKVTPQKIEVLRPGRKKSNNHTVKPRGYRAMGAKQREKYRLQLLDIRDRIAGQIKSLKSESLTRADEVNIEEDGTDAFDRQFALNLASSENEALIAIDVALKRIEEGSYGKCHECGGGIEKARLKALPFVQNCISCQFEVEKHRPGYRPPITID